MRLVPANLVWGAAVILVVFVGLAWPLGGLLLLPVLAKPIAAIFGVACRSVHPAADRLEPALRGEGS
jgi:hypothetical protein